MKSVITTILFDYALRLAPDAAVFLLGIPMGES